MDAQVDPRYITLDSTGNGSLTFRGRRPTLVMQISKITVEAPMTGSGTVSLYYKGQLMTSKAIALLMSAVGVLTLTAGEELEARFVGGPASQKIKVTAHYAEVPAADALPERGFAFTEAVGFADPVDNPVLLSETVASSIGNGVTYDTGVLDVRAFNSFILSAQAFQGTALNTDNWEVDIDFYASAAGVDVVFRDRYTMLPSGIVNGGTVQLTDQMHGGWVRVRIYEPHAIGRTFSLTARLYGSYRSMSNAYYRAAPNGILLATTAVAVGAGLSTAGEAALPAYGTMMVSFGGDNDTARMDIYIGVLPGSSVRYRFDNPNPATRATFQIIVPKHQMWIVLTNTGAVANTIRAFIYNQIQPY